MSNKEDLKTCAYVRALNASAGGAFDILINGKPFADKLGYKEHTQYLPANEGTYSFQIFENGAEILERKIEFEKDVKYTVVITGEKDTHTLELVFDESCCVPVDKALVRFINVSAGEEICNVLINGEKKMLDLEYGEAGDYLELEPGEYSLEATCALTGEPKCRVPRAVFSGGRRYAGFIWPV